MVSMAVAEITIKWVVVELICMSSVVPILENAKPITIRSIAEPTEAQFSQSMSLCLGL